MLTQSNQDYQSDELDLRFESLKKMARQAAIDGQAAETIEQELFEGVLRLGHDLYALYLAVQPEDDLGPSVDLPNGRTLVRCEPQKRRLVTLLGEFSITRVVYAARPSQAAELIPFDHRRSLPKSPFSYPLQDWCQSLSVDLAFKSVSAKIKKFFNVKVTVDSIERMCLLASESVGDFQDTRPAPPPNAEGTILVATIDHKGIPLVRSEAVESKAHRTKGKKPKKRMAAIGCVYTVDPHIRTPQELTATLFHEERPKSPPPESRERRYWSSLSRTVNGASVCGQRVVLEKMALDIAQRRQSEQVLIFLTDGQRSLVTGKQACFPRDAQTIEVLDLMHVNQRLWEAAHLFHAENSKEASEFVRDRLLRVLSGKSADVISELREMGDQQTLAGGPLGRLRILCDFLLSNLHRMRYDEYLSAGFPIATGVIEGACRHVIKDRMERSGMRWKVQGAQAMLQLRTIDANGLFDDYHAYRVQDEKRRLYPYQELLSQTQQTVAA